MNGQVSPEDGGDGTARTRRLIACADARIEASVLVAEGRGERSESAAEILREAGAEVTVVNDVQAALAAMCSSPPDLIVAEVRWPTGSGFSLLAAARRTNPGVPAVLFT